MTVIEIVLIVLLVLIVLGFIGGLLGARRRDRTRDDLFSRNVAGADQALEHARAEDRGWDRPVMEEVCRAALRNEQPDFEYESVHLVLVDDQPGKDEDRALFVAIGPEGERRVILTRSGDHWGPERVE